MLAGGCAGDCEEVLLFVVAVEVGGGLVEEVFVAPAVLCLLGAVDDEEGRDDDMSAQGTHWFNEKNRTKDALNVVFK